MVFAAWTAYFLWCLGVVPTWCFVFTSLRPARSRLRAWGIASGIALIWPVFMPQYRRWLKRQRSKTWVDLLEEELHAVE